MTVPVFAAGSRSHQRDGSADAPVAVPRRERLPLLVRLVAVHGEHLGRRVGEAVVAPPLDLDRDRELGVSFELDRLG